tara:strand:+ start:328 stop:789 length:462 start_codon:yes stop_codon:yes gene_type:complete
MNSNFKIVFNCITQKHFKFQGRASRKELWLFVICFELLILILKGIFFILSILASSGYILKDTSFLLKLSINSLFLIFFTIPLITVFVRRFHDLNFSGWWYLFFTTLISLGFSTVGKNVDKLFYVSIAFLIIFIILMFRKGTPGSNKYGEPPSC